MLASSWEDAQLKLNLLREYYKNNDLTVNSNKTVIIPFHKGGRLSKIKNFDYDKIIETRIVLHIWAFHFPLLGVLQLLVIISYKKSVAAKSSSLVNLMHGIKKLYCLILYSEVICFAWPKFGEAMFKSGRKSTNYFFKCYWIYLFISQMLWL